MKHLWQVLVVGVALTAGACADSPTSLSLAPERALATVPENIVVPRIRQYDAGKFQNDANGARQYVMQTGADNCYDICDYGGDPGEPVGGTGGDVDVNGMGIEAAYTEAYFVADALVGHAEMSVILADHATQDMTLVTSRADGSALGTQKFSTARAWPGPVLLVQTLTTDGRIFAPKCAGRGQGSSIHEASLKVGDFTSLRRLTSFSALMYQSPCPSPTSSTGGGGSSGGSTGGGGGLRICYREDHYSSTGEYIYTETLYCYDVYAA